MTFDGKAFGEDIVGIVQTFVEREVAPLKAENEGLKQRLASLEAKPEPDFLPLVAEEVGKAVANIPVPADGTSLTVEDVAPTIVEEVGKAVALIPVPKDGADADLNDVKAMIDEAMNSVKAEPHPSLEQQSALAAHFLRKEMGDTTLELPPLPAPEQNVTVDVHLPEKGVEETVVTERDEKGRVAKFERREVK